jgi:transposase
MSGYDLTDFEWRVIEPLLPNKPRGGTRADDRQVLNGSFWVLRSGAPWRDLPERYGLRTTCYNRFVRWRRAGVWDRLMDAITAASDGDRQHIHPGAGSQRSRLGRHLTVGAHRINRRSCSCGLASRAVDSVQ